LRAVFETPEQRTDVTESRADSLELEQIVAQLPAFDGRPQGPLEFLVCRTGVKSRSLSNDRPYIVDAKNSFEILVGYCASVEKPNQASCGLKMENQVNSR